MKWIELSIDTTSEGLEPLGGILEGLGIREIQIEDERDFQEFCEEKREYWNYIDEEAVKNIKGVHRIRAFLPGDGSGPLTESLVEEKLSEVRAGDKDGLFGPLFLTRRLIREEDWERNWQAFYKPLPVGEKILIRPLWEQGEAAGRIVVNMDPGLAFGTGQHESTRLCLEALEKIVRPGDRVLDIGCGSGILAITALLLGAGFGMGIDIDPIAAETAAKNAGLNGLPEGRFVSRCGELSDTVTGVFDIVCANIVADVIVSLAGPVRPFIAPEGFFLVSGILAEYAGEVERGLLKNGFRIAGKKEKNGWVSFLCALHNKETIRF